MNILHAIILGIVEGITEFLPISSTGHLILTSHLLQIPSSEFLTTFEIAIQSGAIGAALILYAKRIFGSRKLFVNLCISFVPTILIGLLFHSLFEKVFSSPSLVVWALGIGGIIMILVELFLQKKKEVSSESIAEPTSLQALIIGLGQCCAFIPGVSRSAATIITGRLLGLNQKAVVGYSFMLGIPTLAAATGYSLITTSASFSSQEWLLLAIGSLTSLIVAYIVIQAFIKILGEKTFIAFGIYRIIVALAFLSLIL